MIVKKLFKGAVSRLALHTHTHTHQVFTRRKIKEKGGAYSVASLFFLGAKEEVESI